MTDPNLADKTYIEPLNTHFLEKIISKKDQMHCYQQWEDKLL